MSHSLTLNPYEGFHSHFKYNSIPLHKPHDWGVFDIISCQPCPVLPLWQPCWLPPWSSDGLSVVLPQGTGSCCSLVWNADLLHGLFPHFIQISAQMTPPRRSHFWLGSLRSSHFLSLLPRFMFLHSMCHKRLPLLGPPPSSRWRLTLTTLLPVAPSSFPQSSPGSNGVYEYF